MHLLIVFCTCLRLYAPHVLLLWEVENAKKNKGINGRRESELLQEGNDIRTGIFIQPRELLQFYIARKMFKGGEKQRRQGHKGSGHLLWDLFPFLSVPKVQNWFHFKHLNCPRGSLLGSVINIKIALELFLNWMQSAKAVSYHFIFFSLLDFCFYLMPASVCFQQIGICEQLFVSEVKKNILALKSNWKLTLKFDVSQPCKVKRWGIEQFLGSQYALENIKEWIKSVKQRDRWQNQWIILANTYAFRSVFILCQSQYPVCKEKDASDQS